MMYCITFWFNKCQKANNISKLWKACISGWFISSCCRGTDCVLWRMMAAFITRQQHNNIPHVDRSPYSPQYSGGAARPFLPELNSRSPSPLALKISPGCFVVRDESGMHSARFGFCPLSHPSSWKDRMLFSVAVIMLPVDNCDTIPTGKKWQQDITERRRDANSRSPAASQINPPKILMKLNLHSNNEKWAVISLHRQLPKRILIEFNCGRDWTQIFLYACINKRQPLSTTPTLMWGYEEECIEAEERKAFTVRALIWNYYPGWHTMNKR